ncbi:dethiobiotin synthase [Arthrobacter psychrolactophilus]|uniref:ATP-dependent dethiobiotin synthetase BioD n=1 Tax=Arthrobacter psychrolactophilus TaxID=92442 RepID=A0A2V5IVI0_9MICC|nr:dethiobiotin synthase [Arthrobacter psychrolactophilus]
MRLPAVVLVTGTDTDVGKTLTTAALAAALQADGASVAVYKPVQTGVAAGDGGDMGEVRRLAGTRDCLEGARLALPMAPVAAAFRESTTLPALAVHVATVQSLAAGHDHVLVEGAGGLLVELDHDGNTIADLALALPDSAVVVVCRSGLGTLNHTLLTLEALGARGLNAAGLVIGAWPHEPGAVELDNEEFLSRLAVPLLGCLPEQASLLPGQHFLASAPEWLGIWATLRGNEERPAGLGRTTKRNI